MYFTGMQAEIFIETPRLILREILPSDAEALFEMDADPEVHRYLGNNPITDIQEARDAIAFIRRQYQELGIGRWAVEEKETGRFAGWSGLKFIKDARGRFTDYHDIGYRFMPRYWGNGYATETALASVKYAFDTMKLSSVIGTTHIDNIASQKVLEKAGLSYIGSWATEDVKPEWNGLLLKWFERTNVGRL